MAPEAEKDILLALDAGVRQTGWAVFRSGKLTETGLIGARKKNGLKGAERVAILVDQLDGLITQYRPRWVACCRPTRINWGVPSLGMLEESLQDWAERQQVTLRNYTTQEIRSAIAGFSNASAERLSYAIMVRLGLIGQKRTSHEWEAAATGYYHLCRWSHSK